MKIIKIVVAEELALIRKSLIYYLSSHENIKVIGETNSIDDLYRILHMHMANVVLLDRKLLGDNCIETLKITKKNFPFTKIIVLGHNSHKENVKKLLKNGAWGYMSKNSTPEELMNSITNVSNGNKYISNDMQSALWNDLDKKQVEHPDITSRESEIIKLITKGLSSKEISEKLFISIKTVESHRGNIYRKLKIKRVVDLVNIAKEKLYI